MGQLFFPVLSMLRSRDRVPTNYKVAFAILSVLDANNVFYRFLCAVRIYCLGMFLFCFNLFANMFKLIFNDI